MSINLHASLDDIEIPLWQTPTHVSHMCMIDCRGEIYSSRRGREAARALRIYLEWAKTVSPFMTKYGSSDGNERHLSEIIGYLNPPFKGLKVWIV